MTDEGSSITGFLRARYDEREQQANAAAVDGAQWRYSDSGIYPSDESRHPGAIVAGTYDYLDESYGKHIAGNDPQYVLADLNSKRAILDEHKPAEGDAESCDKCEYGWWSDRMRQIFPCKTLRMLAVPFAGHPDYQESWKP